MIYSRIISDREGPNGSHVKLQLWAQNPLSIDHEIRILAACIPLLWLANPMLSERESLPSKPQVSSAPVRAESDQALVLSIDKVKHWPMALHPTSKHPFFLDLQACWYISKKWSLRIDHDWVWSHFLMIIIHFDIILDYHHDHYHHDPVLKWPFWDYHHDEWEIW